MWERRWVFLCRVWVWWNCIVWIIFSPYHLENKKGWKIWFQSFFVIDKFRELSFRSIQKVKVFFFFDSFYISSGKIIDSIFIVSNKIGILFSSISNNCIFEFSTIFDMRVFPCRISKSTKMILLIKIYCLCIYRIADRRQNDVSACIGYCP